MDVTLQEVRVETFLPADSGTETILHRLASRPLRPSRRNGSGPDASASSFG